MSFFPSPPVVEAEVFTRLPDRHRRGDENSWGAANRPGRLVDSFLEGPCIDRQGRLYVTNIPYGQIFRIDARGGWELVAEYDGWPNGMKIGPDGHAVITDYKNGLIKLDLESGVVTPLLTHVGSEGLKGVNDLVFGPGGDIYFTDQGQTGLQDPSGRVYKLSPDGRLTRLISNGPSPNGIALDPLSESLFIAMTRANQIWRLPLLPSGLVLKVGAFVNLHGGPVGPDGIAFDASGNLFICHAGCGRVWGVDAMAIPFICIRAPASVGAMTTNLVFGGDDMKTLFIVESGTGSILKAPAPFSGLRLPQQAP